MNMKKLMTIVVAAISMVAFAKGIYFVSGGDFRECRVKFTVETTNENQTVLVTPNMVGLLRNYGNPTYAGPWSIKTMGVEHGYSEYENVNFSQPKGSCYNADPWNFTYPNTGRHLVKMYDQNANIFQIYFQNNNDITSMKIDYEGIPSGDKFVGSIQFKVTKCAKMEDLYIGFPGEGGFTLREINYMPKLKNVTMSNPEVISTMAGNNIFRQVGVTNDMVFANVTNCASGAFMWSPYIEYASFPNIRSFQGSTFNLGSDENGEGLSKAKIQTRNLGLKRLRVGDGLEYVGSNCFWRHTNLHTIEFVTADDNWIAAWNNHAILPRWFGTATAVEGETDKATLTPPPQVIDDFYSVSSEHPTPTNLVWIKRVD